jgi:hypothetical protein
MTGKSIREASIFSALAHLREKASEAPDISHPKLSPNREKNH